MTIQTSGTATLSVPSAGKGTGVNGSVTLTVVSGTGYTVGSPSSATITVFDPTPDS